MLLNYVHHPSKLKRGGRRVVAWTAKAGREEKQLGRQNFVLLRNTSPPRLQRKDAISTSEPSLSDPDRDESKFNFTVGGVRAAKPPLTNPEHHLSLSDSDRLRLLLRICRMLQKNMILHTFFGRAAKCNIKTQ